MAAAQPVAVAQPRVPVPVEPADGPTGRGRQSAHPPAAPPPAVADLGYPYPAPEDGAIRVPVSYQGSGTGAVQAGTVQAGTVQAGTVQVPGQPGGDRPAWADEAALREGDTLDSYPAAGLPPVDVSVLADEGRPAELAARPPARSWPDDDTAEDAAIVLDDSTGVDRADDSKTEGDGGEEDHAAHGYAAAEQAAETGAVTGRTGPRGSTADDDASETGSAPATNVSAGTGAADGSRPGHNGTPARVSTAPRAGAPVAAQHTAGPADPDRRPSDLDHLPVGPDRRPADWDQLPAADQSRPAIPGGSQPRVAAAADRSAVPGSRLRPGRRPYTPKPMPSRPADSPPGEPADPAEDPLARPGAPAAEVAAHGLLTAPLPAGTDVPAGAPDGPAAPDPDEQPTGDVEPVGAATGNLGLSGTIAAELAGWAAGELPGQASARLAAWATVGGVPAPAYRDSQASTAF
jgi:hypothetical protein